MVITHEITLAILTPKMKRLIWGEHYYSGKTQAYLLVKLKQWLQGICEVKNTIVGFQKSRCIFNENDCWIEYTLFSV